MPTTNPSMLKHPSPGDLFLSRTKASDWEWAQQALAMGFSPFTALSKETSWALAAARYDRKNGARIATRLVQDLLHTLNTSTQRDAIDALSELGSCIVGAIEHGNRAFLVQLEPAFDALPENARTKCGQFLGVGVHPRMGPLVWSTVLMVSQDKAQANKDWGWTSELPWPTTLVTVDGRLDDLWGVVKKAREQARRTAQTPSDLIDGLVTRLGEQITPHSLDRAFNVVRHFKPENWTDDHRDQMRTIVETVACLPHPPSLTLDGRDMFYEWKGMIEVFPTADQPTLQASAQRLEMALLRRAVDEQTPTPENRARSRL